MQSRRGYRTLWTFRQGLNKDNGDIDSFGLHLNVMVQGGGSCEDLSKAILVETLKCCSWNWSFLVQIQVFMCHTRNVLFMCFANDQSDSETNSNLL